MVLQPGRFTAFFAMCSTLAMPVSHAHAADLARLRPAAMEAYDASGDVAQGWRRRHRRGGVDAGEIIAGVLVLGGVAAIASAAGRNRSDNRERYPRNARYPDNARSRTPGGGYTQDRGLTRAIDMCVAEVGRSSNRSRVASVEDAGRDARGWQVSGALEDGSTFSCRIGNDGRIGEITFGSRSQGNYGIAAEPQMRDRQYSEETYSRLRAQQRDDARADEAPDYRAPVDGDIYGDAPRPAYPGGPLPGEDGYDETIADRGLAPSV